MIDEAAPDGMAGSWDTNRGVAELSDMADPLAVQRHGLVAALVARNPGLPAVIAQHRYARLERLLASEHAGGARRLSPRTAAFFAQIPDAARADYICGFILALGGSLQRRFARSGLPADCLHRYRAAFSRMFDEMAEGTFVADPRSAVCVQDMALATLTLVPGAALLYRPGVAIGPRRLLRAGPGVWAKVWQAGGRSRFLEQHVDARMPASDLEPCGLEDSLALAAQLLGADPRLRGICGKAWFYDPAAGRISPQLAFLHDIPAARGAVFFRIGPEAGTDQPCRHGMIWPRAEVLKHYG